jgi:hypothetical protein
MTGRCESSTAYLFCQERDMRKDGRGIQEDQSTHHGSRSSASHHKNIARLNICIQSTLVHLLFVFVCLCLCVLFVFLLLHLDRIRLGVRVAGNRSIGVRNLRAFALRLIGSAPRTLNCETSHLCRIPSGESHTAGRYRTRRPKHSDRRPCADSMRPGKRAFHLGVECC